MDVRGPSVIGERVRPVPSARPGVGRGFNVAARTLMRFWPSQALFVYGLRIPDRYALSHIPGASYTAAAYISSLVGCAIQHDSTVVTLRSRRSIPALAGRQPAQLSEAWRFRILPSTSAALRSHLQGKHGPAWDILVSY